MLPTPYFIALAMCSPIALNALLPALPHIAQQLSLDISTVQLNYSLYLLALALGQLSVGAFTSRFGNRRTLLFGIALFIFGSLLSTLPLPLIAMLVGRLAQGFGGAITLSLARGLLVASASKQESSQKMGYIVMAIALSQSIAPLIGSFLDSTLGWRAIFGLSAIQGGVLFILSWRWVPSSHTTTQGFSLLSMLKAYLLLLKEQEFRLYTFANTLIAICFYVFVSSAPYISADYSASSHAFGYWFISISVAFMIGGYISTQLNQHLPLDKTIIIGHGISLVGALSLLICQFYFPGHYTSLFVPMCLVTFGRGISQPSHQTAAISTLSSHSSMAAGLMGFLQLALGALVSQVTPLIVTLNIHLIFIVIVLCVMLAGFSHLHHYKKKLK